MRDVVQASMEFFYFFGEVYRKRPRFVIFLNKNESLSSYFTQTSFKKQLPLFQNIPIFIGLIFLSTLFCQTLVKVDKQHNEIIKKTSVGSGLSDNQETIKQLSLNACRAEGAHPLVTELTCITDGAKNCWSIANALKPCCKKLINVLDWFHITKRFTIVLNGVDNDMKIRLEKVKWFLWHGNVQAIKRNRR